MKINENSMKINENFQTFRLVYSWSHNDVMRLLPSNSDAATIYTRRAMRATPPDYNLPNPGAANLISKQANKMSKMIKKHRLYDL